VDAARARKVLTDHVRGRFPDAFFELPLAGRSIPREEAPSLWAGAGLGPASRAFLYVHVPFCLRKCTFCKYASVPVGDRSQVGPYLAEVAREADAFAPVFEGVPFRSFYMGGGSVTVLREDELDDLLGRLFSRFRVADGAERNVEFNPESATDGHFDVLLRHRIGRVSCGVQTLDARILARYGRKAPAPERLAHLLARARDEFAWNNVDLMVGLEGQTREGFLADVDGVLAHRPCEVHCYFYLSVKGDAQQDVMDGRDALAEEIRRRHGRDYEVTIGEFMIHLSARRRRDVRFETYSLHSWADAHTLGLGTFATSRVVGACEYTLVGASADVRAFPPGYEEVCWAVRSMMMRHEVPHAEHERLFGTPIPGRLADALAGIESEGVLRRRGSEGWNVADRDRIPDAAVALAPDGWLPVMVRNLPLTLPAEVAAAEAPGIAAFLARLFPPAGGVAATSIVLGEDAFTVRLAARGGSPLEAWIRPHDPSQRAFATAGDIDVVLKGEPAGGPALDAVRRAAGLLARYRMADLHAHVRRLVAEHRYGLH